MALLLSKSDFKIASSCPTKLFYKKKGYPTSLEGNEYMEYLAEGGYIVGKLATLLYPGGINIDTGNDHEEAVRLTREYLKLENVTLFEASILSGGKLVRIDILEKKGNNVNLIEVKSKSWDSVNTDYRDLTEYIEDVTFQYLVLTEAYPMFTVQPYLFLPDKSKHTSIQGLNLLFTIEEIHNTGKFRGYNVAVDESRLDDILKDDILTLVDMKTKVHEFLPEVKRRTNIFLKSLENGLAKIVEPLSKNCFKCEFSTTDDSYSKDGYAECWKDMPSPDNHIKDLYHVGTIGGTKNPLVNELIKNNRVSIFDIPVNRLNGIRGTRQKIQIDYTRKEQEWFSEDLRDELDKWEYPLHFIDFETATSAIPFNKGMRPYETIAFQWSCHTIVSPGTEPIHNEWLSLEQGFPNFKFAESLMNYVGNKGTFLMWATHENTVLKGIYYQMMDYQYLNPKLKSWLEEIVKMDANDSGKFIDMNDLTLKHYFHPLMKGKTSIKKTLPAVLSQGSSERIRKWLSSFEQSLSLLNENNNPYQQLPPIGIFDNAEQVSDGTGAMRAYEDLLLGINKGNEVVKAKYAEALLRYCKLDTLAMVIIWEHWRVSLGRT